MIRSKALIGLLAVIGITTSCQAMAFNLQIVPTSDDFAVGFTPGAPVSVQQLGVTRDDPSHSVHSITQLRVATTKNGANNIGSLDAEFTKATVTCQPSGFGELYNVTVYLNNEKVGSCETNGSIAVPILTLSDSSKVKLKVSKVSK